MNFAFTLCSTSLHGKTVAVRQLQKLKVDAIPVSIFSIVQFSCQSRSVLYVDKNTA